MFTGSTDASCQPSKATVQTRSVAVNGRRRNGSGRNCLPVTGRDARGEDRILEPGCQAVDQLRVAGDRATLSPRRHVGNRPTRGVEADRRADGVRDTLHDYLLVAVGEVRVLLVPVAA